VGVVVAASQLRMKPLPTSQLDHVRVDATMQFILALAAEQDEFRDRELGPIHLVKYVYLADLAFAAKNAGQTFTGAAWQFHHFGPWDAGVFARIEPALAAVGAEPKRIASNRADDFVRYCLGREDAERIRRELERALPSVIIFRLAGAVHEFGSDTASLLRAVYQTLPMLNAAPEEALDMGTVVREATAEYEVHANKATTKSQRRDRQRRLSEIRAEVQARLARHAQIPLTDQPAPRYDDVFAAGVQWLDSLAGEPVPVGEGELAIAPTFGILSP
jgi:hypothetical protein